MRARKVAARRPWWAWLREREACTPAMKYAMSKASLMVALRDLERERPEARASWLAWLLGALLDAGDGRGCPREFRDRPGASDAVRDARAWHVLDCWKNGYADCDFGTSEARRRRMERDYPRVAAVAERGIRALWKRVAGDPDSRWLRRR